MRQSIIYIKGFSDLASRMDTIVLSALVYHLTSSVWWLSASLAAGVLGGLLSSIASGVLADRMDRRKLMIYSDLLRALLILLIIPLPYPVTILFVRFGLGFLTSFFEVSFQAEIPQIFKHKNIFSTNALMARLSSIAMILGFFSGGAISNFIGYQAVIYFDCFSFIVSAAVLWRFKWSFPEDTQENLPTKNNRFWQSLLADIHEVKDYLSLRIVMYVVFVVYLIDTFGSGSHNVGIPLLADQLTPGRQEFTYGLIWSIWGLGNVCTSFFLHRIPFFQKQPHISYIISTIFMSLGFIVMHATILIPVVLTSAFLTGIADACSVTLFSTIIQMTDNKIRGRIAGISTLINKLGFGIGFITVPILLKNMPLSFMVASLHGLIICTCLISCIIYFRSKMQREIQIDH